MALSSIGPLTSSLIDKCISEVNKKENKDKIYEKVLDPFLLDLSNRYYPYLITTFVILIIIIVLLLSILLLLIMDKKAKN